MRLYFSTRKGESRKRVQSVYFNRLETLRYGELRSTNSKLTLDKIPFGIVADNFNCALVKTILSRNSGQCVKLLMISERLLNQKVSLIRDNYGNARRSRGFASLLRILSAPECLDDAMYTRKSNLLFFLFFCFIIYFLKMRTNVSKTPKPSFI